MFTFKSSSSEINQKSKSDINDLAEFLTSYPETKVVIEGHSDSIGSAAYNKSLSQKRADAVMNALVTEHNIDASRITAIGYGEEQPIADNTSSAGRDKNRRVVAKVNNKK